MKSLTFLPDPLLPKLDWAAIRLQHFERYVQTVSASAKLNGLLTRVGNAAGLLRTLWMRKARLSLEIEHIDTTADEMVLAGAGRALGYRESRRESWNYVRALEHGISTDLPWSPRVIREMRELLLSDVRGEERSPGELRSVGVFIGDRSAGVKSARLVSMPPGDGLVRAMSQLERFVNKTHPEIPPAVRHRTDSLSVRNDLSFWRRERPDRTGLISRSLVKEGLEHPVVPGCRRSIFHAGH